jgi:hypothetical protein
LKNTSLAPPVERVTQHGAGVTEQARDPNTFKPVELASATAETAVWTPASGKAFRILGMVLTASAQTKLTFKDGTGLTTIFCVELAANTPLQITETLLGKFGIGSGAAGRVLTVTRSNAAILNGTIVGTEE